MLSHTGLNGSVSLTVSRACSAGRFGTVQFSLNAMVRGLIHSAHAHSPLTSSIASRCRYGAAYNSRCTMGQLMMMPEEPYREPPGPVIKPFSTKLKIWNSSINRER